MRSSLQPSSLPLFVLVNSKALTQGRGVAAPCKNQAPMSYSRKYPHPPLWTTLGAQKFQDFQKGQQQFIQDSKPCWFRILGNSRILQDFEWFSWNSGQISQNLGKILGIPVRLTEHLSQDFQCRPWGGVWIFSGIAQYSSLYVGRAKNVEKQLASLILFSSRGIWRTDLTHCMDCVLVYVSGGLWRFHQRYTHRRRFGY